MFQLVLMLHLVIAFILIVLVLLQQGKGADAGASFGGGGSSQSVFGSDSTGGNFMLRVTALFATVFFATSLTLAYLGAQKSKGFESVIDKVVPAVQTNQPVIPE
jgi:preprotein translocase subunit SecG